MPQKVTVLLYLHDTETGQVTLPKSRISSDSSFIMQIVACKTVTSLTDIMS